MAIPTDTTENGGMATTAKREVSAKSREVMQLAKDRARDGFDEQKHVAARELHTVADVLRSGCDGVRARQDSFVAPYIERVADQVERFSSTIENKSVDEIVRDVEQFARRRPALFLGGCFVLGVAAARFLKSTEPRHIYNLPASTDGVNRSSPRYGEGYATEQGYANDIGFGESRFDQNR